MRIAITIIILFISKCLFSQINGPYIGAPNNKTINRGNLQSDSGIVASYNYADTTSANLGVIKNIPNAIITVNDSLWMRSHDGTVWRRIASDSTRSNSSFNFDDSAYAQRDERYYQDNFINRVVNSTLPTTYAAYHPRGFNEFDIEEDSDGQKILVFDSRTSLQWIKFTTDADLQSKVGTASDITIKVTTSAFPTLLIHNGRYYIYYNDGSNNTVMIEGANTTELQSCTPVTVWNSFAASDWSVRENPRGGFISSGYVGIGIPAIWTSPSLYGPWTYQGNIFWEDATLGFDEVPGYGTHNADGMVFFKGNRCFYMMNSFSPAIEFVSHIVISEIDLSTYKVIGRPIQFISYNGAAFQTSLGTQGPYNPVFFQSGGTEQIWYVGSSGNIAAPDTGWIAHFNISLLDSGSRNQITKPPQSASAWGGYLTDPQSNISHHTYGTVTNTASGGIATSSASSGIWNYLSSQSAYNYDIYVRFKVNSLPSGQATIFYIGNAVSSGKYIALRVDSIGKLHLQGLNNTATDYIATGTVSTGVITEFKVSNRRKQDNLGFVLFYSNVIINSQAAIVNTGGAYEPMFTYSLLNDSSGTQTSGHQLNGAVYAFNVSEYKAEDFIRNQSANTITQDFKIFGTGESYAFLSSTYNLKKSNYGFHSSIAGMYWDSTLGVIFVPDPVNGTLFANPSGANAIQITGTNNVILTQGSGNTAVGGTTATSTFNSNGSIRYNYSAQTTTYPITSTDKVIDCTSGTFTVTLPTAVSITGREYTIVNSGSGVITIATTSSQTFKNINATPTTLTLAAVGATAIVGYTVMSNGANWIVVGKVKNE